jgi:hypothetical protein
MIPVKQTMTVANNGQGNCFNACIASIMELPLAQVAQIHPKDKHYWGPWRAWFAERGLCLENHPVKDMPPRGYSIASGKSTRTYPADHAKAGERISHACVAFDGIVVHDPYPLPGGFDEIYTYQTIDPLGEGDTP